MTTSKTTTQLDQEAVARLHTLECLTCGGELELLHGDTFDPCSDCLGPDGKPTGRQIPELSEPCPCNLSVKENMALWTNYSDFAFFASEGGCKNCWRRGQHSEGCLTCNDSNIVPVSVEVAESRLMRRRGFGYVLGQAGYFSVYIRFDYGHGHGSGQTPIQALEAAIMAARTS